MVGAFPIAAVSAAIGLSGAVAAPRPRPRPPRPAPPRPPRAAASPPAAAVEGAPLDAELATGGGAAGGGGFSAATKRRRSSSVDQRRMLIWIGFPGWLTFADEAVRLTASVLDVCSGWALRPCAPVDVENKASSRPRVINVSIRVIFYSLAVGPQPSLGSDASPRATAVPP